MTAAALLEMRGIRKSFPGVHALEGVDLDLHAGEVLALVGENGAGKSTLIKVLGGAVMPDAGTIRIGGEATAGADPVAARRAGVAIIYQEFNLVPALSVRENILLGLERSAGFVPAGDERIRTRALLDLLGLAVDPDAPCRTLSVAGQQVVEIAKALAADARILVMDEPTAALSQHEVDALFSVIASLKRRGIGVIYVSHRLDEIEAIADRVMVLRDGRHVATRAAQDVSRRELIELMVGRVLEQEFPRREPRIGPARLVVRSLRREPQVRDVSFTVGRGEILGLAGLVGSGRTETARLLFGADRLAGGSIELDGRPLAIRCPQDAIRAGICLLTEDRKTQGLILGQSVLRNFGLPNLGRFASAGWIDATRERAAFAGHASRMRLRDNAADRPAATLSGGNQQKVVLAKWLESGAEVFIFDEPTRGVDVGAKFEIYGLMNDLAAAGKAVIMISSELPEVLGMADRILVMHEGRIAGEITAPREATQADVLALAIGQPHDTQEPRCQEPR